MTYAKAVASISRKFSSKVRKVLGSSGVREVNRINRQRNDNSCATHDFIDANDLMLDAMREFTGRRSMPRGGAAQIEYMNLWNDAWTKSKRSGFKASK